jgi:ATP-dependent RNA helicase DDX3X
MSHYSKSGPSSGSSSSSYTGSYGNSNSNRDYQSSSNSGYSGSYSGSSGNYSSSRDYSNSYNSKAYGSNNNSGRDYSSSYNSKGYGSYGSNTSDDAYSNAVFSGDVAPIIDGSSESIFQLTGANKGINFSKYNDIPVSITAAYGDPPPAAFENFSQMQLHPSIKENITRAKYETPTPVQKYAIPAVLHGRDIMACAQTGSGKTAAFLIPVIEKILQTPPQSGWGRKVAAPQCLILSPTRELTSQIHVENLKFCYKTSLKGAVVYGGTNIGSQIRELSYGCDILVGTPGRLIDMVDKGVVTLREVRYLILDEADRMLDMGFEKDIRKIVEERDMLSCEYRNTLMFSATFPKDIRQLATDFLKRDHLFLKVGRIGSTTESIKQVIKLVSDFEKQSEVMKDLKDIPGRTLIFAETKRDTDLLARFLYSKGYSCTGIHGDRSQNEREAALRAFKAGRTQILVATDVAARGLDIDDVQHVINFDLPKTIDSYVHRIGRTGRAGNLGVATSYFNDASRGMARDLVKVLRESNQLIPPFLAALENEPKQKNRGRGPNGSFPQRGSGYGNSGRPSNGSFGNYGSYSNSGGYSSSNSAVSYPSNSGGYSSSGYQSGASTYNSGGYNPNTPSGYNSGSSGYATSAYSSGYSGNDSKRESNSIYAGLPTSFGAPKY